MLLSSGEHHLGTRPRGCGYRGDPGLERPTEEADELDGRPFLDRLEGTAEEFESTLLRRRRLESRWPLNTSPGSTPEGCGGGLLTQTLASSGCSLRWRAGWAPRTRTRTG